ncbi:hypothetical protein BD289DRAFT_217130 [Coniella lustricola]|uniref:Tafazzin family protein n=1 Tax=Coniella lustricola TaxID=2025994 RepID=A0A2T3ABB2_9PEZI|nr:hypothetical protein BD289DRAFT_217130 [Coniella lustricola]
MTTTIAHGQYPQRRPNGLWRGSSAMVMGITGMLSKSFLNGCSNLEVIGLDKFVELLESRQDPYERQRGLITGMAHELSFSSNKTRLSYSNLYYCRSTVSNHISVVDDPLIWGVLPLGIAYQPWNLRWGLGAHDIIFKNQFMSMFFNLGQVLPIHRKMHSPHAGPFQPSMTQAIRLLSAYPFKTLPDHVPLAPAQPKTVTMQTLLAELRDPFSDGSLIYSTTGEDVFTAPSAFLSNRHAWVHVFPEGLVHQHPQRQMRYFKWGVARLILEAEPMPDLVPMFIDGTSDVMHESRQWPRSVPRAGKDVKVVFGDKVDMESTFGDLRTRWKALVRREFEKRTAEIAEAEAQIERDTRLSDKALAADRQAGRHGIVAARGAAALPLGSRKKPDVLRVGDLTEDLKYNKEAEAIRVEVALRVRNEVLKLRKTLGYPDEDPKEKLGLAETWARDPKQTKQSPVDGSIEKPST